MADYFGNKYFPPKYFPPKFFGTGEVDPNALSGSASITVSASGTLTDASVPEVLPEAAPGGVGRQRLKYFERLPRPAPVEPTPVVEKPKRRKIKAKPVEVQAEPDWTAELLLLMAA